MAGITLYCQGCNSRLELNVSSAAVASCPKCGSRQFTSRPRPTTMPIPPHQLFNIKGMY